MQTIPDGGSEITSTNEEDLRLWEILFVKELTSSGLEPNPFAEGRKIFQILLISSIRFQSIGNGALPAEIFLILF